jgi:hypothetical protein
MNVEEIIMSNLLRSTLVFMVLVGAAVPALAYPEHTIYVDTSHYGSTDIGMITGSSYDEADRGAR